MTDAVGEEEERESWGEGDPMPMSEACEAPSVELMSLFSSSLLRRDTEMDLALSMAGTLGMDDAGRLVEAVLIKCSCTGISA